VEKGMQEGLSAGITHSLEGRKLTDVAAYNPSTEVDYLSALQRLQSVNFSLIGELKSNKDASVDTIMNLLRLEDTLAERLGRWPFILEDTLAVYITRLRFRYSLYFCAHRACLSAMFRCQSWPP
ncbi:hypothetical protein Tco_0431925, partial [Tanacetum coccineum]